MAERAALVGQDHHGQWLDVLDRAGRLQIPREYLDELGLARRGKKVRVTLDGRRIVVELPEDGKDAGVEDPWAKGERPEEGVRQ